LSNNQGRKKMQTIHQGNWGGASDFPVGYQRENDFISAGETDWETEIISKAIGALTRTSASWKHEETAPLKPVKTNVNLPEQLKLNFSADEKVFRELAAQWRKETRHISSVSTTWGTLALGFVCHYR
jgi:hypothetical protein